MIRNYFKTAIRVLLRHKSYSLINIGGLAIGMSVCILIFSYVFFELSFDKFHDKAAQIYRVGVNATVGGNTDNLALSSAPMSEALREDFPEVIANTRVLISGDQEFSVGEQKFIQDGILYADSSFFNIFSFKLIQGNPTEVLLNPKSIVLTESTAKKFFGDKNSVGEIIRINGTTTYTVTGVMEDIPPNSQLQFKLIIRMDLRDPTSRFARVTRNWGSISMYSYVLLDKNADYLKLQEKFEDFKIRHTQYLIDMGVHFDLFLQPLTDIHLHSDLEREIENKGDITYVYLFSAIAIFILFIACINYMNLASARSFKRAKEVGMRKIHGATRSQLIRQFLSESILFSVLAFIFSLSIVQLTMPIFNDLVYQYERSTDFYNNFILMGSFIAITLLVGILSGYYPAFYMSSFSPINALKGSKIRGKKKSLSRNVLVVLQFSIAVALIICTAVIYDQINYIKKKDLGFDLENRIIIPMRSAELRAKSEILRNEFNTLPNVESVSISNGAPGTIVSGTGYYPEGTDGNNPVIIYNSTIDDQFVETMGMEIVKGRNFSHEFGTDTMAILVNEELAKRYNWAEPIGKKLSISTGENSPRIDFNVVGVLKDFHFKSLLIKVEPFAYHYSPTDLGNIVLKLNAENKEIALKQVEEKWAELTNNATFNFIFLDENFQKSYKSYIRMGKLFTVFTMIAIFVACIGLFGLASFLTEIRTKEIGIRKVQGASIFSILRLLNTDFIKWVLVANVITWPLAYYYMTEWLANFEYHVSLSWINFVLGAVLSIIIALITVSYQSLRSATRNPVDSLRYE